MVDKSMGILSDPEIYACLNSQSRVSGVGPWGGFAYDLDLSVPYITCAIHAGHRVRDELLPLMSISDMERLTEEDSATDWIISDCPSTIWGLDSRAEYDLNRPIDLALPLTPERFWGMQVYGSPPTEAMQQRSLEKYSAFYRFVATVIQILLDRFGACVIYDIHSYNGWRQVENGHHLPPVFNLGTRSINHARWEKPVLTWLTCLSRIRIPDVFTTVAENEVFGGEGAFCHKLTSWGPNILVLSTEILKMYMDENSGALHDVRTDILKKTLGEAIVEHGSAFRKSFCR